MFNAPLGRRRANMEMQMSGAWLPMWIIGAPLILIIVDWDDGAEGVVVLAHCVCRRCAFAGGQSLI
jgi:hypothetical protein